MQTALRFTGPRNPTSNFSHFSHIGYSDTPTVGYS